MSDVNQAFLRAYVRSRVEAGSQGTKTTQGNMQLRVDPAPTQAPATQAPAAKAPAAKAPGTRPAATQPEAPSAGKTTAGRTGVWSPLGVERGVKAAVVSQTPPAVVRNATTPVPIDSTLVRTRHSPAPTLAVEEKSPSLETLNQAWNKKRAPSLSELKLKNGPNVAPNPEPGPAAPVSPGVESSTASPTQTRTDPPNSHRVAGPHTHPVSQRAVDRESLQKLPLPVAFAPSWEVDSFLWPEVVVRLEQSDPNAFRQIGHHIARANQSGLKVLAVTSGERGVGRSTVAMHLARAAACSGLRVAVVDTDATNPSLVDQLRLDLEHGWQDCLFEAVPLEEVAVHAISDSVTLFPLTEAVSPQQVHANLHRMSKLIRRISNAFDLVVLDSGRLHLDQRFLIGVSSERVVDAAVVVVDTELSIKEKIDSAISILQSLGLNSIGLVENFRS